MRHPANPPTLHFFCGKPGAGKTTLALQLARDHDAILISEDIWLLRLFGEEMKVFDDYVRVSRKLKAVVGPLTVDLLKAGLSVVLDFQANTQAGRAWFRTVFEQAGAAHVLHLLNTPDATCLERIARRNIERPEGSHHVTPDVFFQVSSFFQAPEEHEGFKIRTYDARTP
jgi:predicted kinase